MKLDMHTGQYVQRVAAEGAQIAARAQQQRTVHAAAADGLHRRGGVAVGGAQHDFIGMGDPVDALNQLAGTRRRGRRGVEAQDRKSTRLNSSHVKISYAVFCLKKKKKNKKKI